MWFVTGNASTSRNVYGNEKKGPGSRVAINEEREEGTFTKKNSSEHRVESTVELQFFILEEEESNKEA